MLNVTAILLVTGLIGRFEYKKIKKLDSKKDKWVFVVGTTVAATLSVALVLGYYIPNLSKGFEIVYQPITDPIVTILDTYKSK
ncbi:hypothetical protein [Aquibacillus saliphilus]|uniref:hypothetical protein n=1 Tax=Aquibacillus saliphilus TaxID=1909422 RepID=UPI001CF0BC15|nr:hypothetical protein [Aquibacillus saliphilus]